MTFLRAKAMLETRPEFRNFFNEHQIGYLFHLGLVRGRSVRRGAEICLEDVSKIIEFKKGIRS
jgi:hypothetical protein